MFALLEFTGVFGLDRRGAKRGGPRLKRRFRSDAGAEDTALEAWLGPTARGCSAAGVPEGSSRWPGCSTRRAQRGGVWVLFVISPKYVKFDIRGFWFFIFQDRIGSILPNMTESQRKDIGGRIAAARKAVGLSQREVAEMLGIPSRTLSYYESPDGDLPSSLLVPLADVLGVDVDELLGVERNRKSAPKGHLQERVEEVRGLPRKDQRYVIKFLDQVIDDYDRRRRKGTNRAEK